MTDLVNAHAGNHGNEILERKGQGKITSSTNVSDLEDLGGGIIEQLERQIKIAKIAGISPTDSWPILKLCFDKEKRTPTSLRILEFLTE